MTEDLRELTQLAEEKGKMQEQQRIAKAFYDYPKRESLPIEVQIDIARIIGVNL